MSRVVTDALITTRAARVRLATRAEPFWRGMEGGIAIG